MGPSVRRLAHSCQIIAVGPGIRDRDGVLHAVELKIGETVLLPEYGGTPIKVRVCVVQVRYG